MGNNLRDLSDIFVLAYTWFAEAPALLRDQTRASLPLKFTDDHKKLITELVKDGGHSVSEIIELVEANSKHFGWPSARTYSVRKFVKELLKIMRKQKQDDSDFIPLVQREIR